MTKFDSAQFKENGQFSQDKFDDLLRSDFDFQEVESAALSASNFGANAPQQLENLEIFIQCLAETEPSNSVTWLPNIEKLSLKGFDLSDTNNSAVNNIRQSLADLISYKILKSLDLNGTTLKKAGVSNDSDPAMLATLCSGGKDLKVDIRNTGFTAKDLNNPQVSNDAKANIQVDRPALPQKGQTVATGIGAALREKQENIMAARNAQKEVGEASPENDQKGPRR